MEQILTEDPPDRASEDVLWEIYSNLGRLKNMTIEQIEHWAKIFVYNNHLKNLNTSKIKEYKGLLDGENDHTDYQFFQLVVFLVKGLIKDNKEMIKESINGLEALKNFQTIDLNVKNDKIEIEILSPDKNTDNPENNENTPRKVLKIFSIF